MLPEHWDNETKRIRPEYSENNIYNAIIEDELKEYRKQIEKPEILGIEINFDTLFEDDGKRINCTVSDSFNQVIERLESVEKFGSAS